MDIWNRFLYIIGFVLGLLGFLAGPLSASAEAAPMQPSFTYGEGITAEEYYGVYNQTLCYDYSPVTGGLARAVDSKLVVEADGLYYATNAGISWGACPTTAESAPDLYVTHCTRNIGDMNRSYGYSFSRGYVTDTIGAFVLYLIHSAQSHSCDASTVDIFDSAAYPNWEIACMQGPVLFPQNGEMYRCDPNPLRYGTP